MSPQYLRECSQNLFVAAALVVLAAVVLVVSVAGVGVVVVAAVKSAWRVRPALTPSERA
jgi:hypothetical protein